MSNAAKVLEPLVRRLPAMPEVPKVDEECGEEYSWGFQGNISQSPSWVTDGRILLRQRHGSGRDQAG